MSVITIRDLKVYYEVPNGNVRAVDDVSFDIEEGTIIGLLGESGCGKSTLARAILRDLPENGDIVEGEILLGDEDISTMSPDRLREVRWDRIAYVPQSAMASLDPVFTIKSQLIETIQAHRSMGRADCLDRAREVMEVVGIDPSRLDDYPHQLSGGMKQRVILAMSFLLNPDLIVADEPTTGVDVLVRDKILRDIELYRDEFDTSILYISHDIADMVETCDRLLVMYGGKIVEKGPSREVFRTPNHPYTMGLKNSLPDIHTSPGEVIMMDMNPPDLLEPPEGCRFIDKCPFAIDECSTAHPEFVEVGEQSTACYRGDEAEQLRSRSKEVSWAR